MRDAVSCDADWISRRFAASYLSRELDLGNFYVLCHLRPHSRNWNELVPEIEQEERPTLRPQPYDRTRRSRPIADTIDQAARDARTERMTARISRRDAAPQNHLLAKLITIARSTRAMARELLGSG